MRCSFRLKAFFLLQILKVFILRTMSHLLFLWCAFAIASSLAQQNVKVSQIEPMKFNELIQGVVGETPSTVRCFRGRVPVGKSLIVPELSSAKAVDIIIGHSEGPLMKKPTSLFGGDLNDWIFGLKL